MKQTLFPSRGFTLIEALIGILIACLAALGLQALQTHITRQSNEARHVDEATRLAHEQLERLRADSPLTSAERYTLHTSEAGEDGQPLRAASVHVTWGDSAQGAMSGVTLNTVLEPRAPEWTGLLARPIAEGQALRAADGRDPRVPAFALPLGGGLSALPLAADYAAIVRNSDAQVIQACNPGTATPSAKDITAMRRQGACTASVAMVVSGYIHRTAPDVPWPTGIDTHGIVRNQAPGDAPIRCSLKAVLPQPGITLADGAGHAGAEARYHVCVIPLDAPRTWSGTMKLAGLPAGSGLVVCRIEFAPNLGEPNGRNVQPYVDVSRSLHQQNYVVARSIDGNCPSGWSPPGVASAVLHQDTLAP